MLGGSTDLVLAEVSMRKRRGGGRDARIVRDSLVPAVGGDTVVAKGFGLCTGASEG